jgi:hypothetical protein
MRISSIMNSVIMEETVGSERSTCQISFSKHRQEFFPRHFFQRSLQINETICRLNRRVPYLIKFSVPAEAPNSMILKLSQRHMYLDLFLSHNPLVTCYPVDYHARGVSHNLDTV